MICKEIYIVGIGNNSIVTIELAELNGYQIKGLLHYKKDLVGQKRWGYPIISETDAFLSQDINDMNFALSMGRNSVRKELFNKIQSRGGNTPILVHPNASVSKVCKLYAGVQIHANATIQPEVIIQQNTIISYGVGITHNVKIDSHCYIAAHSIIGAYTDIEENVTIGMGVTTVSEKVRNIGENAIIGAGSLVLNPVPSNTTVYGSPAR
ncbi:hypothetical protein [Aequorivita sinensis]|uniref:PglD-related sugar-binding protein n=1 Tax=Aequorivita sinensis TaxID=1382458 RepID=UPI002301A2D7|nr:hypothetical protein [Aequorivita sinensis]